ncbi:hypothetical protein ASE14_09900 [Agromyces sp. Root81]|uniref:DUF1801 domain-containing protein n=1 Tax=Agromyces sp. Root81 TaxID=1736601 RepID=UPI0007008D12|nr:DUF1801 domain-containing protein [Agromyces sp. Root81]KRC61222.1 hypothetical protein ASE14_09900 [Agromyces sp. Root81]
MATEFTDASVHEFIDQVAHPVRRRDAETLLELFTRVTGEQPRMWGRSIIGFGEYHYTYESGREGDAPAAAFSPRKAATTVYLVPGLTEDPALLDRLGPHSTGLTCLYLKNLADVDLDVLAELVRESYASVTEGPEQPDAREGGS